MSGYRTLLRLQLMDRLAMLRGGSWRKADGKADWQSIGTGVAVVLLTVVLLGVVVALEWFLFRALTTVGQVWLLPALALMIAMVGTAVLSFFQVMAQLYFTRDVPLMAALPVHSSAVMSAKITWIYLGEAAINACILLPALILCGLHTGAGAAYWITAAAVTLLAPMLPLALLTLLSTLLARVTSFFRHKDALVMVGSMLMVVVVLTLEMSVVSRIPEDADTMYFIRLLLDREALLTQLTGSIPPVMWALDALRGSWTKLGLFACVSLASLGAVVAIIGPRYLSIALAQQERSARRKQIRAEGRHMRPASTLKALYRLEMRTLLRTPAYVFNGVFGALAVPLIMVYMVVISQFSEEMTSTLDAVQLFLAMVPASDVALIVAALIALCCCMNPAAATAVSREGKRISHTRTLPVKAETLLTAKLLCGATITLVTSCAMVLGCCFLMPTTAQMLPGALMISLLASLGGMAASLAWDAAHPQLDWPTETYAIKQNMNVLFGMLFGLAAVLIPALGGVTLLRMPHAIRFGGVAILCALEAAAGLLLLKKSAAHLQRQEKGLA